MNAKTQLTDDAKLQHAISILEIVAMFADNADHHCDDTQFNLTGNPEHLKLASRSIFAARAMIKQIGFIADTALESLGGAPFREGTTEKWISEALKKGGSGGDQAQEV